jgi:hypothetical protein
MIVPKFAVPSLPTHKTPRFRDCSVKTVGEAWSDQIFFRRLRHPEMMRDLLHMPRAVWMRPFKIDGIFTDQLLDSGETTDEPVAFTDMFDEFSQHMKAIGCRELNSKQVERNYTFDDFPDIPAESTYLKVAYPFSSMQFFVYL